MPTQALFRHHAVTEAERAVLVLVAGGFTDIQIAKLLGIGAPAVKSRLHRFYERADVSGRSAVAWCVVHAGCCLAEQAYMQPIDSWRLRLSPL